jgi:hypothetical protein
MPFLLAAGLAAQSEGDPALRTRVDAEARRIYDAPKQPVFLLRSQCPPSLGKCGGTEITGYFLSGELVRIVAATWDPRGRRGLEYFAVSGALAMLYESHEYFEETAPPGAWRNFKRLPSWERRVYFRNGEVGYTETTGAAPALNPKNVLSGYNELRSLLEQVRRKP